MSPLHKTEILILEGFQTGNTSEVVHAVSPDLGRLSLYARGLNRPRNPLRGALQPLSRTEVTLHLRDGGEMATLRDASLLEERSRLAGDLERFALALLIVEAAWAGCHPCQESPEIYHAALHGLDRLDPSSPHSAPTAACHALVELLEAAGYLPGIDPALTTGWPAGRPRPHLFWLEIDSGRVHLDGAQPSRAPHWPLPVAPDARRIGLPPAAVRLLWEHGQSRPLPPLDEPQALQFLDAMVRLLEYHQDAHLKSARFWAKLHGA